MLWNTLKYIIDVTFVAPVCSVPRLIARCLLPHGVEVSTVLHHPSLRYSGVSVVMQQYSARLLEVRGIRQQQSLRRPLVIEMD